MYSLLFERSPGAWLFLIYELSYLREYSTTLGNSTIFAKFHSLKHILMIIPSLGSTGCDGL